MSTLLYILILITILSCTSTALPLKCFLQNYHFTTTPSRRFNSVPFYDIYNIRFDPIKLDFLRIVEDDFLFETKDLQYIGMDDAILDEFSVNLKSNSTRMIFHFDLAGKGLYKFEGTLFSKPISGEGPVLAYFKNIIVDLVMPFNIIQDKDGRKFIELQKFYYQEEISGNAKFRFSNLYNGDEEKSEAMHTLINQNWKIFTLKYSKHYIREIVHHIFDVIKNLLLSMPLMDVATC